MSVVSPFLASYFTDSTIVRAETRRNWGFYLFADELRTFVSGGSPAALRRRGRAHRARNAQFLSTFRNILTSSEKLPACVFFITLARWTSTVLGLMPIS